ncbi:MAG: hypothetical protein RR228_02720 [Bacilli bacterium]
MKNKLFKILLVMFLFIPFVIQGKEKNINMYLFYGKECPHCEEEIAFLNDYLKENKNITLHKYEVWHNTENDKKFESVRNILNSSSTGVPFLVIGNEFIVGYGKGYTEENIKDKVSYYLNNDYVDKTGIELNVKLPVNNKEDKPSSDKDHSINVPLLGKINPTDISLPLLSAVIGFVDGINPCAMWILLFLITMLLGMKNRKRMWAIGLTFILSSSVCYGLFMVSWLNIASYLNSVTIFKVLVGVFAIIFGTYNIINFFKTKDIGCNVVDKRKKNKIITKVKEIVTSNSFIIAIASTILLAFVVNVIELACSLGLPVIFTQVLSLNDINIVKKTIYILIYLLFFMIDDIIIFIIAMKTLKITALSNKYAKYSHFIGGIIMLLIGLLMIFKPAWLMFNF